MTDTESKHIHFQNLDEARSFLDLQSDSNTNWTGPHLDWSAHTISTILEAGLRDIVSAICDVSDRIDAAIDQQGTTNATANDAKHANDSTDNRATANSPADQ